MKDFLLYFFGAGNKQEFALFTLAHILPIVWMVAMILLMYRFREPIRKWKHEGYLRYILAFGLICAEMAYYWRLVAIPALGPNPVEHLPIGVCTWALIFCSYMVIGKSQTLFDIAYFWLLSGSVFALLTPTPLTYTGPTRFRYYQFWAAHTLPFIAVFYMIFIHGMRPNRKSILKAYIALLVLAVIAFWANTMIPGANYLFLAKPEAAPSVLDILPPNFFLRTFIIAAVITLLFGVAYLPWHLKDKNAGKV
jgi:hypothetical integral membrane protein (TIGR02206 family)